MNLVTECQAAVGKLDAAMAPLLSKKETQLALLHDVQGEFSAGVQDGLYQVRITLPAPDQQKL